MKYIAWKMTCEEDQRISTGKVGELLRDMQQVWEAENKQGLKEQ